MYSDAILAQVLARVSDETNSSCATDIAISHALPLLKTTLLQAVVKYNGLLLLQFAGSTIVVLPYSLEIGCGIFTRDFPQLYFSRAHAIHRGLYACPCRPSALFACPCRPSGSLRVPVPSVRLFSYYSAEKMSEFSGFGDLHLDDDSSLK